MPPTHTSCQFSLCSGFLLGSQRGNKRTPQGEGRTVMEGMSLASSLKAHTCGWHLSLPLLPGLSTAFQGSLLHLSDPRCSKHSVPSVSSGIFTPSHYVEAPLCVSTCAGTHICAEAREQDQLSFLALFFETALLASQRRLAVQQTPGTHPALPGITGPCYCSWILTCGFWV